ncbi:hypothetical protein [Zhouia amylolytica]|uniref:hypothetical protein n=1 Tax=Zhouia amylolytica TaxID=376730 RepID=UPI0020CEA279|nr:hypothetical protein [Zhouia amylolytica]MCQ0113052.1 hypothetical protein [Zhouia amylolytica]
MNLIKNIIGIVILFLLYNCGTNKKPETGELILTGKYCKYPNDDFFSLAFQLFKNGKHIANDTIEFNGFSKYKNLPYGKYQITFESIYGLQESVEIEIKNNIEEVILCMDKLNYDLTDSDLLINNLNPNQSLKIDFQSLGCFHFNKSVLEITRTNEQYLAKLGDKKMILSAAQLQLIKEFEIELREIESNECTTVDTYKLTNEQNSESVEIIDESCIWHGFRHLVEKLGLDPIGS